MTDIIFDRAQYGEPMVDLYENQTSAKVTQRISLNKWLFGNNSRDIVELARSMSLDVFRARFISQSPAITPSGVLGRPALPVWPQHPTTFTFNGIICIEVVSNGVTSEELEKLKVDLGQRFENLYYAGLSTSGNGLILLFKIFSTDHYGLGYMSVCEELKERFGLTVDVSHLNFRHLLPPVYDPNPYFNPMATDNFRLSFRLGRWSNKGERNYEESERIIYQVAILTDQIVEKKIQMLKDNRVGSQIGCSLVAEFGEYGRCFFNQIASVSDGYDKSKRNAQYDNCMKYTHQSMSEGQGYRSSIGTFFHHCKAHGLEIPAFAKL